jgi:FkbM family methyltransferase
MNVDPDLLKRYAAPASELTVEPGCFTNWIGLKTDASLFSRGDELRDRVFADLPIANDGVYGDYAEYASWLTAISAKKAHDTFVAVELGAGWGPWISGIGVTCLRQSFEKISLIGVEADRGKYEAMQRHLERNGLLASPRVSCRTHHAAAWSENTTLNFPVIGLLDHGGAVQEQGAGPDYRGAQLQYTEVPALNVATICAPHEHIDFMHWDLQGAEVEVAPAAMPFLNDHVDHIFIGTHSRPIEGTLLNLFFENRWEVLHERPCHFVYDLDKPSIVGMVHTDGELFVRNPRLAAFPSR